MSVKALAADLVFGVPPLPEEVPPPNTNPIPTDPRPLQQTGGPSTRPSRPPVGGGLPLGAEAPCPAAAPDEFPDEVASTDVTKLPKAGDYRWVVNGEQTLQTGRTYKFPQFTDRSIENVQKRAFGHSFVTVERELVAGSAVEVKQSWEVRTVSTGLPNNPETDTRGIFLTQIERLTGGARSVFNPSPDLQFLRLPVVTGPRTVSRTGGVSHGGQVETVGSDSSGDPSTAGSVLTHRGIAEKQVDVDACGTKIRGWFVNGDQEFVSPTGEQYARNYDYVVATQLGGFLIQEIIASPSAAPTLKLLVRIGQVEPES